MDLARRAAVVATAAVLAAALVLGTLDTLVWLPQATAPGIPLSEVYAALARSHDLLLAVSGAVGWLVVWTVVSAILVMATMPAPRFFQPVARAARPIVVLAAGAGVLAVMLFFHWWSAFAMGNAVSDELPPYTGTLSPVGTALQLVGAAAAAVGVLLGAVALSTRTASARS